MAGDRPGTHRVDDDLVTFCEQVGQTMLAKEQRRSVASALEQMTPSQRCRLGLACARLDLLGLTSEIRTAQREVERLRRLASDLQNQAR